MLACRTWPAKEAVAEGLDAELVPMGSAGGKAMAVIRGEADIYLHTGVQSGWDSCVSEAVAAAHGLRTSHADGRPLAYNKVEVYLPDLLTCRPKWADKVLGLMKALVVPAE